jgi:hypothetical protein
MQKLRSLATKYGHALLSRAKVSSIVCSLSPLNDMANPEFELKKDSKDVALVFKICVVHVCP